jgi:5-methyltetrahydrofolate--homocysteine methyltransferase
MRPSFIQAVEDAHRRGRIILMDGPMGTELQQSGLDMEKELAHRWNLSHPESVKVVYEDYTNAGAEALLTNTFSAHLGFLRGDDDWLAAIEAGIELARQPEWDHLYCLGSAGSAVGNDAKIIPGLVQTIAALQNCDGVLLETQTRMDRVRDVVDALPFADQTPLIVSFSFSRLRGTSECWIAETPNGTARTAGEVAAWADGQARRLPYLAALGVNCCVNLRLDDFVDIIRDYRKQTDLPLLARPGITSTIECEFNPRELAAQVKDFADAGVTLLGGCCGTTPAHIAAMRQEIDRLGLGWQES